MHRTRSSLIATAVASSAHRALLSLALLSSFACDDRSNSSQSTLPAPTTFAASIPATAPASQPAAVFTIDGKPLEFPPAKLVLTKKSGGLAAILCSDDPPAAIEPNYVGNSFMIEMKLDVDEPAELPTAVWEYKTEKRQPQDTPTGIFLSGARRQLQPIDVKITFQKQAERIVATVVGRFVLFDSRDVAAPTQLVDVSAKLDAAVQQQ